MNIRDILHLFHNGEAVVIAEKHGDNLSGILVKASEHYQLSDTVLFGRKTHGSILVALSDEYSRSLGFKQQNTLFNDFVHNKQLTVSVKCHDEVDEYCNDTEERDVKTIHALADMRSTNMDFESPGNVAVMIAKRGGLLKMVGYNEAATDLAKMSGLVPSAVYAEITSLPDNVPVVPVEELIALRRENDKIIHEAAIAKMPTEYGEFEIHAFENALTGEHHVALTMGDITDGEPVLLRVHSECLTGDAFHSLRCDCGEQLAAALKAVAKEGRGAVLYMRQEGRGIGLVNKIRAYELQDDGKDTVEANILLGFPPDLRDYGVGAQILYELGIRKIRLLTNNPTKVVGLSGFGLDIIERVPILIDPNQVNQFYMDTKKDKMGHLI